MNHRPTAICFSLALAALLIAVVLVPDREISYTERRRLEQFPAVSVSGVLSGEWTPAFERWLLDQFPGREAFRSLALGFRTRVLLQGDYNGVYVVNGKAASIEYPLNEASVTALAEKINALCDEHFPYSRAYCALIPDKGYYLSGERGRLALDFERMEALLADGLEGVSYLSVKGLLNADCYYDTDIHWRQERILPVVQRLLRAMDAGGPPPEYEPRSYAPFYGSYYSQAVGVEADELVYLSSPDIARARVENLQKPEFGGVYDEAALGGMDSYDVFFSGATPFIRVLNTAPAPAAKGRTLVLVRDSFGSSLAPLLLHAYETIVLLDLRYMSSSILSEYLQTGAHTDVLFLYGAQLANNSGLLR